MNKKPSRLRQRLAVAIPLIWVVFLVFGLIGVFVYGYDSFIGWWILGMTAMGWVLNRIVQESFIAWALWRQMNEEDEK